MVVAVLSPMYFKKKSRSQWSTRFSLNYTSDIYLGFALINLGNHDERLASKHSDLLHFRLSVGWLMRFAREPCLCV